jgi:ethanolamine utilization protein EutN
MVLGRVIGEVWGARHHPALVGRKLVLVRPYLWYAPPHPSDHLVAVDSVDASVGDDVVVCLGDGARRTLGSVNLPVEAAVLGIVDKVELAADVGPRPLAFHGGEPPHTLVRP